MSDEASLQRHLEWLYGDGDYTPGVAPGVVCICEHAWEGTGDLYGIRMGKQWVRTTTHPKCPHHGSVGAVMHERRRAFLAAQIKAGMSHEDAYEAWEKNRSVDNEEETP